MGAVLLAACAASDCFAAACRVHTFVTSRAIFTNVLHGPADQGILFSAAEMRRTGPISCPTCHAMQCTRPGQRAVRPDVSASASRALTAGCVKGASLAAGAVAVRAAATLPAFVKVPGL
jgi:hypothetical protein